MKVIFAILGCLIFSGAAFGQQTVAKIDHLTAEEDELVREAQELDRRIEIYVKAIDRRFLVLNGATQQAAKEPKKKKDALNLGALPTGTQTELLVDVRSLLDEAINKVDDAAERDSENPLLPKALKILADGCARFTTELKPFGEKAANDIERSAVYDTAQTCAAVQEAINTKQSGAAKPESSGNP